MKKIAALLLLLIFSFSLLTSCDTENSDGTNSENENTDNGKEENNGSNIDEGYDVGELAIDFPLNYVIGEGEDSIKNHRGKVVVINFWGTWCGPCKSELPHFDLLADEYSDEVVFMLVHSVSYIEDAPDYINEKFPDSRMIFLKDVPLSKTSDMYFTLLGGTNAYPRTVVLDADGVITYADNGALSYDDMKSEIEKALK